MRTHSFAPGLLLAIAVAAPAVASPGAPDSGAPMQCLAHSPDHALALVELYTSEGCSSCPPADHWVSALADLARRDRQLVPLAFHVDYWDRLGWVDRFASPQATARQRRQAGPYGQVYTPQVRVQGRDYPTWYEAQPLLREIARINSRQSAVRLALDSRLRPGRPVEVALDIRAQTSLPAGSVVHWVGYRNALASEVTRGENAGRELRHDRVVGPWFASRTLSGASVSIRDVWPDKPAPKPGDGLAAWVEAPDGAVIQALDCAYASP